MAKQALVSQIEVKVAEHDHTQLKASFSIESGRRGVNIFAASYKNEGEIFRSVPIQMDLDEARDLRAALDSAITHSEAEAKRHGDT